MLLEKHLLVPRHKKNKDGGFPGPLHEYVRHKVACVHSVRLDDSVFGLCRCLLQPAIRIVGCGRAGVLSGKERLKGDIAFAVGLCETARHTPIVSTMMERNPAAGVCSRLGCAFYVGQATIHIMASRSAHPASFLRKRSAEVVKLCVCAQ